MFKKENRWWDPIAGGSLFLIFFLAAYSLELTNWTYDLDRITSLALFGIIAGFLIGQSMFRKRFSNALIFLYALFIFLLLFVFSLSNESSWIDRLVILTNRIQSAWEQVLENVPLDDGILFLSSMAVIFCLASINAGYYFTRYGKPWYPLGIIVCSFYTIQYFLSPLNRNGLIITAFSLFVILFFGRVFYLNQNKRWTTLGYQEDQETSGFLTKIIFVVSVIFTITIWGVPFLNKRISQMTEWESFQSIQEYSESWERIKNFLYPLRPQVGLSDGLFPETLALGSSRSLDEDVILQVHVPEDSSHTERYYWKARVYSSYENGFWGNESLEYSSLNKIEIKPNVFFDNEILPYTFVYHTNEEMIVTPQIVIDVDGNANVGFFSHGNDKQDVISFSNYGSLRIGDQITVKGGYYEFQFDLRETSEYEYPEWVQSRYLSLPEGFSPAIRNLADEITRDKDSVLDQALAITSYLRNTFGYKDNVEVSRGDDPIEWFLFNGKEGFCNYFASAEVLMLRSLGIPSRMVVGYAQGERLNEKKIYEVKKKDSHSWVEVFFPEQGWIIFEPTPSQPRISYAQDVIPEIIIEGRNTHRNDALEDEQNFERLDNLEMSNDLLLKEDISKKTSWKYFLWILPFLMLVLIVIAGFQIFILREKPISLPIALHEKMLKRDKKEPKWIRKWADYERLSLFEKNFQVIKFISITLGISKDLIQTPKEFLMNLYSTIDQDDHHGLYFMEKYHQEKYGKQKIQYTKIIKASYLMILRTIVLKKISQIKEKIRFRFRLLRV